MLVFTAGATVPEVSSQPLDLETTSIAFSNTDAYKLIGPLLFKNVNSFYDSSSLTSGEKKTRQASVQVGIMICKVGYSIIALDNCG